MKIISSILYLLAFFIVSTCSASSFIPHLSSFSDSATLAGHVRDSATHEALAGVRIELRELHSGANSDSAGNFTIKGLPAGKIGIEIHLLGYSTLKKSVTLAEGKTTTIA